MKIVEEESNCFMRRYIKTEGERMKLIVIFLNSAKMPVSAADGILIILSSSDIFAMLNLIQLTASVQRYLCYNKSIIVTKKW
jgi:hypothetical protein